MPNYVSFDGSSSTTVSITANGSWTAQTDQSWLSLSPTSGSGNATLTLNVDRTGLTPGDYAASVLLKGADPLETVTVYMRFAQVSGNITGPAGQILPQSVSAAPAVAPGAEYAPGQVLAKVSTGYLAVQGMAPQALGGRITPQSITPQAVQSAAATIAQAHGLSVQSFIAPGSPWAVLSTNGQGVAQAVTALRGDGRVAAAQPNYLVHASAASVPVKTAGISAASRSHRSRCTSTSGT